jgi:1-acyl-sn-glycerol-3-phosphate acyltransferase
MDANIETALQRLEQAAMQVLRSNKSHSFGGTLMIVSLVVLVVIVVLSLPSAVIFIPLAVITGNVVPLYTVAGWIVRTGFFVAGIRVRVEGREQVPAGRACIFMANHVSNLDPPALVPRLPGRTVAFTKRSVFKLPIFGYCLKLGDFIPVDRTGSAADAKKSVALAGEVLKKGVHITTFVEGTRSPDGRMLPFKKGPFYLAMETGAPCIPVSIYGTETLMAKGSFGIKPGKAHIVFHAPIYPADYATREELMLAVRASIASGLPEWMRA